MNLTLQTIPSPLISELLTYSDLDGIVLDTEHGHFNNETLYSCIQIITLCKKKCFVRFTDLNKQLVRMCLDAGVDGVIFSTIEDATTARNIIDYCKYPSQGGVRGCGLVRENKWGNCKLDGHQPMIIGQIETKTAIDNLDSLIICDFDIFLIGPYDISSSLKIPGNFGDPEYFNYINKIYSKISLNKLGLFLPTIKDINNYKDLNKERPELLILGMDSDFILETIKKVNVW
jgi:2-keto-3-deoxy-L-rhamnonate aldolase RhmA